MAYSNFLIARAWCERIMLENQLWIPNHDMAPMEVGPYASGRLYFSLRHITQPSSVLKVNGPTIPIDEDTQIIISAASPHGFKDLFKAHLESDDQTQILCPVMSLDEAVVFTQELLDAGGRIRHDTTGIAPILSPPSVEIEVFIHP